MESIFGKGNYFVEIMDHDLEDEKRVIPLLVQVSRETGIPLLATNDCHYLRREDADAQEVLMCIQTGKTLDDTNRMRMETRELYVKSEDEMRRVFPEYADAIERTGGSRQRCHVDFVFGETKLPASPPRRAKPASKMFRRLCEKGLAERYQPITQEARDRMEYEIGVISKMGYVDYFLIVWDFINYARSQGSSSVRGAAPAQAPSSPTACISPSSIRCATACCSSASQPGARLHAGYRCGFLL